MENTQERMTGNSIDKDNKIGVVIAAIACAMIELIAFAFAGFFVAQWLNDRMADKNEADMNLESAEENKTGTTSEITSEFTVESTTEETAKRKIEGGIDEYSLYESTIDQWLAQSESHRYTVTDLDGDGIDELIMGYFEDVEVGDVLVDDIYSIKDGKIKHVFSNKDYPYGNGYCYDNSMVCVAGWSSGEWCVHYGFLSYKDFRFTYDIGYCELHLERDVYIRIKDENAYKKLYDELNQGSRYEDEGIIGLIDDNPEKYEKISEQEMRDGVKAYQLLDLKWYAKKSTATSDGQVTEKKASESEVLTDANYEELYASIIEEYRQFWNGEKSYADLTNPTKEDGIKVMFGDEHGDNAAEYTFQDINEDGIKELYICGATNNDAPNALYTLDNQTPVFVYGGWSRNDYTIYDNGKIRNRGSGGAADYIDQVYVFDGKQLSLQFSVYGLYNGYYYDATGEYTSDEVHSIFYEKNPDPWSTVDMYWYDDTSLQLISYEESQQIFDDYFKDAHAVEFTGERYNLESGEVISSNETVK